MRILYPKEVLTWSSEKGLVPGVPLGVVLMLEDKGLEESITPHGFSILFPGIDLRV